MKKKSNTILLASVTIALSVLVTSIVVIGGDVYLHKRYEQVAGLNVWGYRGPPIGAKQTGERRIVVLGGSTAFGYGVPPDQAFPAYLERALNDQHHEQSISIVNLAYNNEGAHSFRYTLDDYAYLDYDIVVLYTGYNDLSDFNREVFRHESPVFRLTGYLPIFPIIFQEKAMILRHDGDLEGAYLGEKTVFRPGIVDRTTAVALETAVRISRSLQRQLNRLADAVEPSEIPTLYPEHWDYYTERIYEAVVHVLNLEKQIIVVTQPYLSELHIAQQRAIANMLAEHWLGSDPSLHYINLGQVGNVKDPLFAYDGMHLTAQGNKKIADNLVRPILAILE